MVKQSRLVLVVSALLLATSVGAAPVAALSPSGFESRVRCYNRTLSTDPELELRRLLVLPPDLGEASASVGWRFIVRRSSDGLTYKETYRSPIQHAQTSDGFTPMGVKVSVPDGWPTHDPEGYPYRVIIKAFFYRADRSIKSTSKPQSTTSGSGLTVATPGGIRHFATGGRVSTAEAGDQAVGGL